MYVYLFDTRGRSLGQMLSLEWLSRRMWSLACDEWGRDECVVTIAIGLTYIVFGILWMMV